MWRVVRHGEPLGIPSANPSRQGGRVVPPAGIDRARLTALIERERGSYRARHPKSRAAFEHGAANLLGGVPMTWMRMWAGGFPLYLDYARGAELVDLDGNRFVDFCLGDTGAMAGHSPEPA